MRVYTPHGGSLHYQWRTAAGFGYLAAERAMIPRTHLFLFESRYGLDAFRAKIGDPGSRAEVVHNGVGADEFAPVATLSDATDLVFIGELRHLKGVDVLIAAIAQLIRTGRQVTATIVGEGPDRAAFQAAAAPLGDAVRFAGAMPARSAFARGRLLVVPSRAESLPYVVLEAGAAGIPMIATNVGGISEIFGPDAYALIAPGDADALARAIGRALEEPQTAQTAAASLRQRVREGFSTDTMTAAVLAAYQHAIARRNG